MPTLARARRGQQRPETFAFLGFTHYCGRTRDGRFVVKRKTHSKRLTSKLNALRQEAKRRMHTPVSDQHRWLCQVLRGHYAYYGLRATSAASWASFTRPDVSVQCAETFAVSGDSTGKPSGFCLRIFPFRFHGSLIPARRDYCFGVTFGKAVCGKSARTDLRGQKPNGFATRPISGLLARGAASSEKIRRF